MLVTVTVTVSSVGRRSTVPVDLQLHYTSLPSILFMLHYITTAAVRDVSGFVRLYEILTKNKFLTLNPAELYGKYVIIG